MNTKIRILGTGACMLAVICLAGIAQQGLSQDKKGDHMEHSEMLQACAKAGSECQRACDACGSHCSHLLAEGGKEHLATLATCQDCATICAAASAIMARGGPFSSTICTACIDACGKCATQCEKFPDDKHMKLCAEECRRCEKACKEMLKHTGK